MATIEIEEEMLRSLLRIAEKGGRFSGRMEEKIRQLNKEISSP